MAEEKTSELQDLIAKFKDLERGCEDKLIDLKILKFEVKDNQMKIYNEFQNYFFKYDAENPKDEKVVHAIKQFCKIQGVPYSFFNKNPEYMRMGMVDCWLPSLKSEKSSVLAKLRKNKEGDYIIRAILPVEHTNLTNSQVMEAVCQEVLDDYKIDFVIGGDRDDLILHVRFISKEEFTVCGEKCSVGFSVVCSELGSSPLSVDTLLYRSASKASFLASYGNESFFSFEYEKIQREDLQKMFPPLITHLREQLTEIKTKIQEAKETVEEKQNIYDLLRTLRMKKGLNEKFHTVMFQEMEKDETVKNKWDFVNKMAIVAKDFSVDKRLKIEKAAGELLGLSFPKT